jgi:hypothetical protein
MVAAGGDDVEWQAMPSRTSHQVQAPSAVFEHLGHTYALRGVEKPCGQRR